MPHSHRSVFLDPSGKRWRAIRRATLALGILSTLVALGLAITFLIPPILPTLQAAKTAVRINARQNRLIVTRDAARKRADRQQLLAALTRKPALPATHTERLPVAVNRAAEPVAARRKVAPDERRPPIVAGFYVNWDDNSFTSFKAHATDLDWVIGEWVFLGKGGTGLKITPDAKVLYVVQNLPAKDRPRVFAMVSNYDGTKFDSGLLRRMLRTPASRQAAAIQLVDAAQKFGFAGITIDFEEVPDDLLDPMFEFMRILRAGLLPGGRLLTSTVAVSTDEALARRYAIANDYVFLMLYDEHYGTGDPGPVASQSWYVEKARRFLSWIPPQKTILALGAYGTDWNDAGPKLTGATLTFQDAMDLARTHGAAVQFDSVSLNPYVTYTDSAGADHIAWFLDGVTAWNQARAGVELGAAGSAIWRLGSEDPSIWHAISNDVPHAQPQLLEDIPGGYDPRFAGKGGLLRITTRPSAGHRLLQADSATQIITHESITEFPSPWVVERFGSSDPGKVALTFDDGPDPRYTNAILDTLASRNAKATFFVVGRQADEYPGILAREIRDGDEIGNHTYTHPNIELTSPFVARLEIVSTGRLIETITNRRTALFRPPYFGDADPTSSEELDAVATGTDLGYLTVGVEMDTEDWRISSPDSILATALAERGNGNVILMHDSGGDRAGTVAILGTLIDSLRASGYEPVLVSELAGITRDEAMPPLAKRTVWAHAVDVVSFGFAGLASWALYWIFLGCVILGVARLLFIITLAAIQRKRSRPDAAEPPFAPPVSVVVPAFREELVIVRTVESLIAQRYAGEIHVIVVDDGSPDDTFANAVRAFGGDPRVTVLSKPNGGKASALNYGIRHATSDIIVCLDADTQFEPETIAALVAPLARPEVGAVAGNAKVGNRVNLVTRWQALEYVTSQNLDRRAFSLLNCITVIPGAVGAWRRSAIVEAGGFTHDTLAEDQDLTIAIRKNGHVIAYAERAIAWTEAPDTLGTLSRQRFRWSFGTLQCAWKHKDALFARKYGTLGFVALPNSWLFGLLLTAISPLADLTFLFSLFSVWLTFKTHGDTYALTDLEHVLLFYGVFLITDWMGAMIAFLMEPDEEKGLSWLIMLQRFAYRQIMYSVVLKSFFAAFRGRVVGWGLLERKATVELPV
jgi:cellulose synthase/poly-beta-1,6-N-acetylglucosamine synthase-like glycosyltransferase/peptidoglycan/xylan/chitin deacetylase (PgdA/CDA1 family)/spore germination protein YaaH